MCVFCQVSGLLMLPQGVCRPGWKGLAFSRSSCCWDASQVRGCLELRVRGTGLCEMLCGRQARNDSWSPGQSLPERSLRPYPREKVLCKLQSRGAKQQKKRGLRDQKTLAPADPAHRSLKLQATL